MTIHGTACPCLTRVSAVDIAFAEHLDLLDLHGRAGAASLGQLDATATLPPHGTTAGAASLEHWATLEIWGWSLAHPGQHWSGRAEPTAPDGHAATVAAIGSELTRLEDLLSAAGPAAPTDFFGRPGTSGDVARLLAHEAIAVAHAASTAAGRSVPGLSPAVAADGVARALEHWAEPDAHVAWQSRPALLRATGSGRSWLVSCGQDRRGGLAALRAAHDGDPAVVVEGPDTSLLWWLHDHEVGGEVTVTGEAEAARTLREALGHRVGPAPRRRAWWRG